MLQCPIMYVCLNFKLNIKIKRKRMKDNFTVYLLFCRTHSFLNTIEGFTNSARGCGSAGPGSSSFVFISDCSNTICSLVPIIYMPSLYPHYVSSIKRAGNEIGKHHQNFPKAASIQSGWIPLETAKISLPIPPLNSNKPKPPRANIYLGNFYHQFRCVRF